MHRKAVWAVGRPVWAVVRPVWAVVRPVWAVGRRMARPRGPSGAGLA
jgi:hypothetical protein